MKLVFATLIVSLAQFGVSAQQRPDTKLYVVTHVDLTPNYAVNGTELLRKFAAESRKDKGVVRFELLRDSARKNHFTIVGVWESQAAFEVTWRPPTPNSFEKSYNRCWEVL